MDILPQFESIFEPALIKEINEFGVLKSFKEGDIIMDYGKYIKMMPLVIRGSIKVLKKNEQGKEILLYYLSSSESCSMAYSCCLEAKKSEVKAIAEENGELMPSRIINWMNGYINIQVGKTILCAVLMNGCLNF